MPLYEYGCNGCGKTLELRQSFNEEPLKTCPSCGGELRRLLHPTGIIFKGSGRYCTDHRSNSSEEKSEGKESCGSCAMANA